MARPRARYFDDDTEIRASVFDVFLELGALDANSRVADWMFADPGSQVPTRITTWAKATPPATPPKRSPLERSPSGDGYETDEGYASATSPGSLKKKSKSKARSVFSIPSAKSSPTPPPKPLPPIRETLQRAESASTVTSTTTTSSTPSTKPLPPIREKLQRTESSSSVSKARALFRKPKQAAAPDAPQQATGDDFEQWLEVGRLTPRVFNPSALNGVPLAPPSSFRSAADPSGAETSSRRQSLTQSLTLPLPRNLIRTLSMTKRRPPSLALKNPPPEPERPRYASSLPPSPFILVTEDGDGGGGGNSAGPTTPFAFLTPTPLRSRFSDVTALMAAGPVYPLSIRRSMVLDNSVDQYVRPRSSSCTSLQDALAASLLSPYDLYNRPIPAIQRGRDAPFPMRPVLPYPLSENGVAMTREATIQRYREFSRYLDGVGTTHTQPTRGYYHDDYDC
ncbi:hypothetical protein C8J57DRAFT_1389178 [Mycena rebaudengoi]|nr:hypothetical protein C8J57DRAFT_1389178 [Mycena rebaudengoi]